MILTKKHSKMLYGIAILMMLYHHLFAVPGRIENEYFSVFGSMEIRIAWFCKICVAIYSFISGYGMCKSLKCTNEHHMLKRLAFDFRYVFKQIIGFLMKYWIVFIIFIPIGYAMKCIGTLDAKEQILSVFGLSRAYNDEWWYIKQYFFMLMLFPVIDTFFESCLKSVRAKTKIIISTIFVLVSCFICWSNVILKPLCVTILPYSVIFFVGYICAHCEIFENKLYRTNSKGIEILICAFILTVCVILRVSLTNSAMFNWVDIVITAPFIYSLCIISDYIPPGFKLLEYLGNYSVYMWLTHTFYCYYYFQKFIIISGISTIIYLKLIVVSLFTAMILLCVETFVRNRLKGEKFNGTD